MGKYCQSNSYFLKNKTLSLKFFLKKKQIQVDIERKFPSILAEEPQDFILKNFAMQYIFIITKRLTSLMAIHLSSTAIRDLESSPSTFEFVQPDLVDIDIRASHMNLVKFEKKSFSSKIFFF